MTPFYAFESTTRHNAKDPQKPEPPRASHFVLFFKVQLPVKSTEVRLNLQRNEVEASAWISKEQVNLVLAKSSEHADEEIEHSITIHDRGA